MKTRRMFVAALLAGAALLLGCEDRTRRDVTPVPAPKDDSRRAGQQVGEAARDAKENVEDFFDGVEEGYGGSGKPEETPPAQQIPPPDFPERARH